MTAMDKHKFDLETSCLDVGLNRTGVRPSDALSLAEKIVSCPALRLSGIQAYAGHVQHIRAYGTRKQTSHQCLQEAVDIFRDLQATVPTCTTFSASGTGTFDIDLAIPEISSCPPTKRRYGYGKNLGFRLSAFCQRHLTAKARDMLMHW